MQSVKLLKMSATSISSDTQSPNQTAANSSENLNINKNKHLALKQALCWAIMFGVGENTFGIFANHIQAPHWFYAALVWIPSFIGPFTQVFAANILERYRKRVFLIYMPVLIQAFSILPIAFIALWQKDPSLISNQDTVKISFIIFLTSLFTFYLSGHFCAPSWQSLVGDLVSENERGSFFGKLSRAANFIMLSGMVFVFGALYFIEKKFENNFTIISCLFAGCFIISFFARYSSGMFIKQMEELPYHVKADSAFTFIQFIKRAPESNFVKFVLFCMVLHCGANISGPYFLIYWTDTLHFSKAQWLILQVVGIISTLLTILIWGRFSDIFGNKRTLKYCAILISIVPFFWLFIFNFYGLLVVQMVSMIFWTGFNLSTGNYIYEAASQPKRARCFAYFNIIIGVGVFIGTQIGLGILSYFSTDFFGISFNSSFAYVLIFSGLVRALACGAFLSTFKELRDVKPLGFQLFWNDVLQFSNLFQIKSNKAKQ